MLAFGKNGAPPLRTESYVEAADGERVGMEGKRQVLRFRHNALLSSGWLTSPDTWPQLEVPVQQPAVAVLRSRPLVTVGGDFDSPLRAPPRPQAEPSSGKVLSVRVGGGG